VRVLVTGATGFVGLWLVEELRRSGHDPVPTPDSRGLDITDRDAVSEFVRACNPDAVAHLAGVASAGDARRDPETALRINEGGTLTLLESLAFRHGTPLLVAGSSEVYGRPNAAEIPLTESAALRAEEPYGRSKLAQERIAIEASASLGLRVVVTRSFNMTGPGQREEFVAPALARRVLDSQRSGATTIPVGNLDVRRDIGDVRDAVRAYRLLLENLAIDHVESGTVVNVCTGRATSIRRVLELLKEIVGAAIEPRIDSALVRSNDPTEIVGDASKLHSLTGWEPRISLDQTLRDLVESMR
jgi:GDP-4-dehydro-6-deoxy-D-mannose reductase